MVRQLRLATDFDLILVVVRSHRQHQVHPSVLLQSQEVLRLSEGELFGRGGRRRVLDNSVAKELAAEVGKSLSAVVIKSASAR
jgi:hypothetical protein